MPSVDSSETNKKILDFFNKAATTEELTKIIIDDPSTGTISNRAYGMRPSVAKKVIETRSRLSNKKFTNLTQIRLIRGIGADTFKDIEFALKAKAVIEKNEDGNGNSPSKKHDVTGIFNASFVRPEDKIEIDNFVKGEFKRRSDELLKIKAKSAEVFKKFVPTSKDENNVSEDEEFDHVKYVEKASKQRAESLLENQENTANLSVDMMKAIGFTEEEDGSFSGTGDVKLYQQILREGELGSSHEKLDSLIPECKLEFEAEEFIERAINGEPIEKNDDTDDQTTNNEDEVLDVKKLQEEKLAIQMKNVTSPENEVLFNVPSRENQEGISQSINKVQFSPGPADVPAYHDFYNLKIAFEHVWTEYFDEDLVDAAKRAYEEWADKEEKGVAGKIPVKFVKAVSIANLAKFAKEGKEETRKTAEGDPRFIRIKSLDSSLTASEWVKFSEEDKGWFQTKIIEYGRRKDSDENPKGEWESIRKPGTKRNSLSYKSNPNYQDPKEIVTEIQDKIKYLRERLYKIPQSVTGLLTPELPESLNEFFEDLELRIKQDYVFKIFAPNSINFGLMINYRQKWTPLNYQVGELVSTIPLTPGETRTYTRKTVVKKTRSEKELEESQSSRSIEISKTARADAEIIRKAAQKSNFQLTSEGGTALKIFGAKVNYNMGMNSANDSSDTKKTFRESVLKSAQSYKETHKQEISTEISEEEEFTETGKIFNPNEELSLTCLFYELQRRYKIQEKLHGTQPVILVANQMPKPNEINKQWVLSYSWILKQVILSDSFLPAIDFIKEGLTSSKFMINELRKNLEKQNSVVDKVSEQLRAKSEAVRMALDEVQKRVERVADGKDNGSSGIIGGALSLVFGSSDDGTEPDKIREDLAKETLQRLQEESLLLRERLQQEVSAQNQASEKYVEAYGNDLTQKTAILELLVHIKQNILYYMQAIWSFEFEDKRFFRIYGLDVPVNFEPKRNAAITIKDTNVSKVLGATDPQSFVSENKNSSPSNTLVSFPTWDLKAEPKKKLSEVADLDNLIGFKGNYMIFPLLEGNFLTDFMKKDYTDADGKPRDPDPIANYTTEEIYDLIQSCAKHKPELLTPEVKEKFKELIMEKRSSSRKESDEIVVPTDSLYIETLPGARPVLEDFKLIHRAIDVKNAQAAVRREEIDNIRRASKIMKGELEDPDVEKNVTITGDNVKAVTDVTDDDDT